MALTGPNIESPLRVMSLHALAYCERLFYLEEVEEIRVADAAVYAGRALHEELQKAEKEQGEWVDLEVSSETLGLVGKVDCLKRRDGVWVPYEHKRGRAKWDKKKALAWRPDEIQVAAYTMLVEEKTGTQIEEGRVRYHADAVTVKVPLTQGLRQEVKTSVARARQLRQSIRRPPVTTNDRLCIRCSLAPVCLPEEERLIHDPDWEPVRLFPADRERKTLHIVGHGSHISRSSETLKVVPTEGEEVEYPIHELESVVIHGYAQMSTQALYLCADQGVAVHWLSPAGRYVAGLAAGPGSVQRRLRQFKALSDDAFGLGLARRLTMAKMEGQLRYALRATRGMKRDEGDIREPFQTLRAALRGASKALNLDELRGHEGSAGRAYFSLVPKLLGEKVPVEMRYTGRSRRPPEDRFNALLSFGYSLVYQAVLQSVLAVGLEPALGFFHRPRSSGHPLVLDLMELFRIPLWDMVLIGSVNRLQWDIEKDFDVSKGRCWLSPEGRKKAIGLFERRMEETWKHPVVGYSLSYARLVELEVRLLEKEWTGEPGLFARMRLR